MGLFSRKKQSNFVEVSSKNIDPTKLPYGFFIVEANGKQVLAFNDPPQRIPDVEPNGMPKFTTDKNGNKVPVMRTVQSVFGYCLNCGETVVAGGKRITLDVPRELLPIVRLTLPIRQEGVAEVGGAKIIDTSAFDSFGGNFEWDGSPQAEESKKHGDWSIGPCDGLWGGGQGNN